MLGIAIGVAMGLNRKVEWFASPIFIIAQAAPLAALIPLIVFAYGIGLTAKTLVVCIMAMPVIVLNSFAAVRHTPNSLIEMGRSFLASRAQVIRHVILPAASPVIFAGLRLGCAAGFIGAILAELLITPTGVGDLITYNRSIAQLSGDVRRDPLHHALLGAVHRSAGAGRGDDVPAREAGPRMNARMAVAAARPVAQARCRRRGARDHQDLSGRRARRSTISASIFRAAS